MAQMVKRLSTMWETQVRSLGQENPLEKEMPRVSLECNPEIPVAPGEKNSVLDTNLDELYFALQ